LGRDSRTSGELLASAAAAGLRGAGWNVVDLGLVPTPTALLATRADPAARGCLIITASHNPVQWNGLKLGGEDGRFVTRKLGARVEEAYRREPGHAAWDRLGAAGSDGGAIERHLESILALDLLDPGQVARDGPMVALDCVRGAGGAIMPELLARLGCRVIGIHLETDGRFPREPEPTASNLVELGALVKERGADLGMAVDPDVDRLSLVDERGVPVGEDWTLALAVEYVLGHRKGPVVTNLSSSQTIEDAALRGGSRVERTPVGEVHVATRMAEVDAPIGGEGNGGVILPDVNLTRDAATAAALILGLLAERGKKLGELISAWPAYHMTKRKARRPAGALDRLYATLLRAAPGAPEENREDGLRLAWPARKRWVHVRPSGTEPILRVIAEAPTEAEVNRLADWATACVEHPD